MSGKGKRYAQNRALQDPARSPCGTRVCGQSVSAPPWRSRRRSVVHPESAARKVCFAMPSAMKRTFGTPGNKCGARGDFRERYGVVQRMRLYWDFASSAVRARPEGAGRRAQVRLQGPASVCGARPGRVRSLRRWSPIRQPMPRRTPSSTHLENMFWSSPSLADSRKIPPNGGISLPADYPSACRSRAGRGARLFRDSFLRKRRGGGRSADHGATNC